MEITIISCGNVGTALAADLSLKGHTIKILKTSQSGNNANFNKIYNDKKIYITEKKCTECTSVMATTNIKNALENTELIIICVQTNYHEDVIKKISPFIKDNQILLFEPGYLSTCYILKHITKHVFVVEAESSPIDCRIIEPGHINVLFRNVRNFLSIYPEQNQEVVNKLNSLSFSFNYGSHPIEVALHNPNLIIHTVGALFSVPRIEYVQKNGGLYSMYREVFSPHIWNLVEALDNEKIKILDKIGCKKISYLDACKKRNSENINVDAYEVFWDYAMHHAPQGPKIPDSRFITEDISQGLVLLESLGNFLDIQTPIASSLINIANSMFSCDFRKEGRTIKCFGASNLSKLINNCHSK